MPHGSCVIERRWGNIAYRLIDFTEYCTAGEARVRKSGNLMGKKSWGRVGGRRKKKIKKSADNTTSRKEKRGVMKAPNVKPRS